MSLRILIVAMLCSITLLPAIVQADPQLTAIDDSEVRGAFQRAIEERMDRGEEITAAKLAEQLDRGGPAKVAIVQPTTRRLTSAQVYDVAQRSVVMIGSLYKCENCDQWHSTSATGFAISPSIIATNYHVLDRGRNDTPLGIHTIDGKTHVVKEVLAASKHDDLAILRVDADDLTPLPLGLDAPIGSDIFVLSNPVHRYFVFTRGVVSRYSLGRGPASQSSSDGDDAVGKNTKVRRVAITADYSKGSSGAPVIDAFGSVVGVASERVQIPAREGKGLDSTVGKMTFHSCIPVSALRRLIDATPTDNAVAADD